MSSPADDPFGNPYDSPRASSPRYERGSGASLPVFCAAMFTIDLFFLAIRGMLAAVALLAILSGAIPANHSAHQSAVYNVLCGALMVVLGVPADLGLLFRKSWAVALAYLSVLPTLGSLAVGVSLVVGNFPADAPLQAAVMIGVGATHVFRLAIVVAYVAAVMRFSNWRRQHQSAAGSDRAP